LLQSHALAHGPVLALPLGAPESGGGDGDDVLGKREEIHLMRSANIFLLNDKENQPQGEEHEEGKEEGDDDGGDAQRNRHEMISGKKSPFWKFCEMSENLIYQKISEEEGVAASQAWNPSQGRSERFSWAVDGVPSLLLLLLLLLLPLTLVMTAAVLVNVELSS
jgi:hypothetical protein